jgi:hypothetical protein
MTMQMPPRIAVEIDSESQEMTGRCQEGHYPHCVEYTLPGTTPALAKPLNWGKTLGREDRWHTRGAAADMYEVYPSPSSSGWCLTICGKILDQDFDSDRAARGHAAEDWARRMGEAVYAAPGEEAAVTMADALGQGANIYGDPCLVRIKQLIWIDLADSAPELATGISVLGKGFTIFRDDEGQIRWTGAVGDGGVAGSIDEAKQGAQADFNAWVAKAFQKVERSDDLDERMKALGMIPMSELLAGDGALERFTAHAGVQTIDDFREWAKMQHASYLTMRMGYELGDQSMDDSLYEWVFAHEAVFSTIMANLRAVARRSGRAA